MRWLDCRRSVFLCLAACGATWAVARRSVAKIKVSDPGALVGCSDDGFVQATVLKTDRNAFTGFFSLNKETVKLTGK